MDALDLIGMGIAALFAAMFGSMLGLGGGVFLVPLLTLFFEIDPKVAVGASAVCVVTNSVVGSSVHMRSGFTNIRLAMLLQTTTALGA
ncbi:MAG: sulfite exporter TauE/SafE family protein, partial [Chloroflexia bacterium]|nr:sulfite exporter TauE/SafE family protein [Chloroflexia bacterium]